jgi:hypothetical protein
MSGFALDWLKLRERYDCAAGDPGLTRRFAAALPARPRLVDLGAGAGANLRYLAPRLGDGQRWLLVDSDERLLAAALEGPAPPGAVDVEARRLDLARDLGRLDLAACDGIVANALLDLVSAEWLTALVAKAAAAPRPLLLTLTVDGRSVWQPLAAEDALVAAAFARHQRTDKGFGPALDAAALPFLAEHLAASGYDVATARSDWRLGAGDEAILAALVATIAEAGRAAMPESAASIAAWAARRHAEAAAGRLALVLGHLDLLGVPR